LSSVSPGGQGDPEGDLDATGDVRHLGDHQAAQDGAADRQRGRETYRARAVVDTHRETADVDEPRQHVVHQREQQQLGHHPAGR
jgi:hypothetical protein